MIGYRTVVAPLIILTLVLSLFRWRTYATFVLPAVCYVAGLSLYYVVERFRELADPLLMIPVAALLSDIVLRTNDIAGSLSWAAKTLLACLAVGGSICVAVTGLDRSCYQLPPHTSPRPLAPTVDLSAYEFSEIAFVQPPSQYGSRWKCRTREVQIAAADGGLKCTVLGSPDRPGGQYGGLEFPAVAPRALRLDMTFLEADEIECIHVAGYAAGNNKPAIEWVWRRQPNRPMPAERAAYVLLSGSPSGCFIPHGDRNPEAVDGTHVFIRIVPGSESGFILHQVEISA